jgi:hypothetical protein
MHPSGSRSKSVNSVADMYWLSARAGTEYVIFNEREPHSSKWDAPTRARNRGHASCARRECRVPRRTVRRIWCRCPLTGRAGGLDDLEMASLEWVETPTSARAIGRILPAEAEATYYS